MGREGEEGKISHHVCYYVTPCPLALDWAGLNIRVKKKHAPAPPLQVEGIDNLR